MTIVSITRTALTVPGSTNTPRPTDPLQEFKKSIKRDKNCFIDLKSDQD